MILACPSCGTKNRVGPVPRGTPRCASCKTPLPWIVAADEQSFSAETEASVPVLVDFWAPWCGPCRMVGPALERAARELAGRLKVIKVNADEAPGIATRFDVRAIPALLVLRDGRLVARHVGALPADELLSWVRAACSAPAA